LDRDSATSAAIAIAPDAHVEVMSGRIVVRIDRSVALPGPWGAWLGERLGLRAHAKAGAHAEYLAGE